MGNTPSYFRFWVRGLWVFLMLLSINLVLGLTAAALGAMVRGFSRESLLACYLLTLLIVGLPFMGWIFETFASRLPRLVANERDRDAAI